MTVGGDPFPDSGRSPEPFAEALAHLVARLPSRRSWARSTQHFSHEAIYQALFIQGREPCGGS